MNESKEKDYREAKVKMGSVYGYSVIKMICEDCAFYGRCSGPISCPIVKKELSKGGVVNNNG